MVDKQLYTAVFLVVLMTNVIHTLSPVFVLLTNGYNRVNHLI